MEPRPSTRLSPGHLASPRLCQTGARGYGSRYIRHDGKIPYQVWFLSLKDRKAAAKIAKRLDLLRLGNFGNHRGLGGGLAELKIHYGPGYRVYVGLAGPVLVILLCGGDKSGQKRDIETARIYWDDYRDKGR